MLLAALPPCTETAARTAIAAIPSLAPLLNGGGPDRLICADLTGDGVPELTTAVSSGGTAGDIAWVVFRRADGHWRPLHTELGVYKVGLARFGSDLVETQPIYERNDPNCCPTGGFAHRRFHWNGTRLVVLRRWHDKSFTR